MDYQFSFMIKNTMFQIPDYMRQGLIRYIENKIEPGSFLLSILENDLEKTIVNADTNNIKQIPAYIRFLHEYAPHECFGSKEKVKQWLQKS